MNLYSFFFFFFPQGFSREKNSHKSTVQCIDQNTMLTQYKAKLSEPPSLLKIWSAHHSYCKREVTEALYLMRPCVLQSAVCPVGRTAVCKVTFVV